jgi:hypothetical protein
MHIYKVFIHNTLGMEYYSTPEPRSNHLAPGFRWAPDFSRPVADPWNRLDRGHTTPIPHPSISVILPPSPAPSPPPPARRPPSPVVAAPRRSLVPAGLCFPLHPTLDCKCLVTVHARLHRAGNSPARHSGCRGCPLVLCPFVSRLQAPSCRRRGHRSRTSPAR